jgi:hypothetical protein
VITVFHDFSALLMMTITKVHVDFTPGWPFIL